MKELLSPRQVARAIGVSEASLKRWCDKGLLPTIRTAGGHRRIPVNGVVEFLRASGQKLVRPEVLGLPPTTGRGSLVIERACAHVRGALLTGDAEQFRRIIFDLYLARHPASEICDLVIAPAMRAIGDGWEHGEVEVYEERRACEISLRVLHELRSVLLPPAEDAPVAIGGTLEHDPYQLATAMVDLSLREAGWRAESYGSNHPAATLCAAIRDVRPRLFWLSVSALPSTGEFLSAYSDIYAAARTAGVAVVVGGRALTDDVRQRMEYAAFCDTLRHVVAFARTLYDPGREALPTEPQD